MSEEIQEIKVENFLPAIRRTALSFNRTTGIPYEDLLAAAYLAFEYAKKWHDPERGAFITLFYAVCRTRLIDYCHSAYKWQDRNGRNLEDDRQEENTISKEVVSAVLSHQTNHTTPESTTIFKDSIENLSSEAQTICKMIFESPQEFLVLNKPKLSRGKIKDTLREMGWSWSQIWDGFREIKTALSQMD